MNQVVNLNSSLYNIKIFRLLLANLLILHFSNALALLDLLKGTFSGEHHCRGQVGEVGKERSGSQSGILLEYHARNRENQC